MQSQNIYSVSLHHVQLIHGSKTLNQQHDLIADMINRLKPSHDEAHCNYTTPYRSRQAAELSYLNRDYIADSYHMNLLVGTWCTHCNYKTLYNTSELDRQHISPLWSKTIHCIAGLNSMKITQVILASKKNMLLPWISFEVTTIRSREFSTKKWESK